jgi:hypothetical protein
MPGFGDNTTHYQRDGVIPCGGIRVECGCWTEGTDATIYIPTQFTECIAMVVNSDISVFVETIPDVSTGFIVATTTNTTSGATINYVAFGF